MDVFHVGASAPKAPETRNVDRDAVQAKSSVRTVDAASDAFASSSDALAVARHAESPVVHQVVCTLRRDPCELGPRNWLFVAGG